MKMDERAEKEGQRERENEVKIHFLWILTPAGRDPSGTDKTHN